MRVLPMLILGLALPLPASASPVGKVLPTPGTIAVEPADDRAEPPEQAALFTDAVQNALMDAHFLTLPTTSHSRYLAHVTVTRSTRGLAASKANVSDRETHVGNWGANLKVTLPSKKTALQTFVETRLKVDIVLRSTGRPVWSASASTVQAEAAGTGTTPAAANKLAGAVIGQFPGETGVPISVP